MSIGEEIAAFVEKLIADGVHELDPERRKAVVLASVQAEQAKWAAIVSGNETARADAIEARHRTGSGE